MSLFRKVRVLVGALVHKPFMPKSEEINLDRESDSAQQESVHQTRSTLETQGEDVPDRERVADLITRQQQGQAD
jgi:hypothetical protein